VGGAAGASSASALALVLALPKAEAPSMATALAASRRPSCIDGLWRRAAIAVASDHAVL
jgi:hypothetical protein